MKVLAVIGSPRREMGLCHRIASAVLAGASSSGAETEALYLIDGEPEYCIHCGHTCFEEGDCIQEAGATERSLRVSEADSLVICAPVYCWQPSGLMATFFDKTRLATRPWDRGEQHGRWGLGIAVAGGTGTGVFPALQSMYSWLCPWKYRPLDPVPVTRFNLERVLDEAGTWGRQLAQRATKPFESVSEQLLAYDSLPYMNYGRVDEFRWLAEQIALGLRERGKGAEAAEIEGLLAEAEAAAEQSDTEREATHIVEAYRRGADVW